VKFCETTLPNGLEVIAECNPQAYSSAFGFFVKTGSRDENDAVWGVSHFLEHMVFKGTKKRSAADVNRDLDALGSKSNAYTSEEQTVYYAAVLPEYQEPVVELLADIMRPALRQEDFDVEKQVILKEINKYDNQPPFGGYERCMAAHFGTHPLARSVLGTVDSITALTSQQMHEYFQNRYSARNIALVASGNVDFAALVESAQRYCGDWQSSHPTRVTPRATGHGGFEVMYNEVATQEYVVQLANAPAAEDADRYAARLLATILGDDSGSRMFWELVDTGLAEYAAISPYEYQGTGAYMTFLSCAPEDAAENLQRLEQLVAAAESQGITEAELQQAKNKITAHIILQAERSSSRLFSVGSNWIQRREYRPVAEVVKSFESVTLRDVHAILEKYPLSRKTTVCVGPLKDLAPPVV
jgi:predicted Zn-dependent peptidase